MNQTQRMLTDARALLAKPRGWIKGQSVHRVDDWRVAYCATGACRQVVRRNGYSDRTETRALSLLRASFGDVLGMEGFSIIGMNDARKTRKRDVLAAFDAAIERAGEKAK